MAKEIKQEDKQRVENSDTPKKDVSAGYGTAAQERAPDQKGGGVSSGGSGSAPPARE